MEVKENTAPEFKIFKTVPESMKSMHFKSVLPYFLWFAIKKFLSQFIYYILSFFLFYLFHCIFYLCCYAPLSLCHFLLYPTWNWSLYVSIWYENHFCLVFLYLLKDISPNICFTSYEAFHLGALVLTRGSCYVNFVLYFFLIKCYNKISSPNRSHSLKPLIKDLQIVWIPFKFLTLGYHGINLLNLGKIREESTDLFNRKINDWISSRSQPAIEFHGIHHTRLFAILFPLLTKLNLLQSFYGNMGILSDHLDVFRFVIHNIIMRGGFYQKIIVYW